MKKVRLLVVLVLAGVAYASTTATAAALCPAPTWACRYINSNGCCLVVASYPGYYCPELCD